MGAYQQSPTETWSQVVEQTPGCGVAASSGGMTTPSTTTTGMPGYVAPPLGLTLPDFSNWSLPPPEIPPPRGLPTAPQGLPSIGRSDMIRNAVGKHARAQMVTDSQAPSQRAPVPPMSMPHAPMWHHHSISCNQAWLLPRISRQYRCRENPLVGESQWNPPLTKQPPRPVKPLKITGGSRPEDGVTEAGQPVVWGGA